MAESMKILAVSDRVMDHLYSTTVTRNYSDVDLIIGCGDLPFYYLEFLISSLNVPLVYVMGNHDNGPQYTADGRILTSCPGGRHIHGRTVQSKGVLMAGLEGSMRYRPYAPLMYTEGEMRRQVSRLLPGLLWNRIRHGRYLDILVTHSPPLDLHDRSDPAHTGFKIFLNFMRWFKPRFLLHGHIHIYRRDATTVTDFEQTRVMNVYPYRIIEY